MFNEKEIRRIIKKHEEKIEELCQKIPTAFNEGAIHNFRIETKKLRSFLRLINSVQGQSLVKFSKDFKLLYHIAGAIREMQVERRKIKSANLRGDAYLRNLSLNITTLKKEWQTYYVQSMPKVLRQGFKKQQIKSIHPRVLEKYFKTDTGKVVKIIKLKTISDERLHAARKLIKDIANNTKLAGKEHIAEFELVEKTLLPVLHDLSDTLGAYNDVRICLEHLDSFIGAVSAGREEMVSLSAFCEKGKETFAGREKEGDWRSEEDFY